MNAPRLIACLLAAAVAAAPLSAQITQAEYAARRDALVKSLPSDGVLLVRGGPEPKENYLKFWQSENFNYLSGFLEPDAAMVIVRKNGVTQSYLFVQPKDPAQEVWTGVRLGVDGVNGKLGMDGRPASALKAVLDSLLAGGGSLYTVGDFSRGGGADVPGEITPRTEDDQFLDAIKVKHRDVKVADVDRNVMILRSKKSPAELGLIRSAARISAMAHKEVLHMITPEMNEFEVQALAEYTFRRNGADGPSYGSIVGSGPNSTTLHYEKDDRFMHAGEMLNMDMAAYYGAYSADLTRTVPVTGKFAPAQRDVYQIVFDAQAAAERQVHPGQPWKALDDSAVTTLKNGLTKLGLIESPNATYACHEAPGGKCAQYRLYYMHGLGHPIGLDVHDIDQYSNGGLAVGSVFTIEPGIYVRANTIEIIDDVPANAAFRAKIAPAVKKYANIGVRIEDDYEVTATGFDRLTAGAPRTMDEIEAEMAKKTGISARDKATVEAYKKSRP